MPCPLSLVQSFVSVAISPSLSSSLSFSLPLLTPLLSVSLSLSLSGRITAAWGICGQVAAARWLVSLSPSSEAGVTQRETEMRETQKTVGLSVQNRSRQRMKCHAANALAQILGRTSWRFNFEGMIDTFCLKQQGITNSILLSAVWAGSCPANVYLNFMSWQQNGWYSDCSATETHTIVQNTEIWILLKNTLYARRDETSNDTGATLHLMAKC